MYLHTKNELSTSRLSKVKSITDRYTDRQTRPFGWLLLETTHLLLLALRSGTVSLKTSHLLHHCQCFDVNWRLTCFGTRTQTLLLRH